MNTKIDKFAEALKKRNPDRNLVGFFNDMYDEHEQREQYIEELEYTNLGMQLKKDTFLNEIIEIKRIKHSAMKTYKQLKHYRRTGRFLFIKHY